MIHPTSRNPDEIKPLLLRSTYRLRLSEYQYCPQKNASIVSDGHEGRIVEIRNTHSSLGPDAQ